MRIVNQKRKRINLWLQHSEELKEKLGQIGLTTAAEYEHWVKDFYGFLCNGLPLSAWSNTFQLEPCRTSAYPYSQHPQLIPTECHEQLTDFTLAADYWKIERLLKGYTVHCVSETSVSRLPTLCALFQGLTNRQCSTTRVHSQHH